MPLDSVTGWQIIVLPDAKPHRAVLSYAGYAHKLNARPTWVLKMRAELSDKDKSPVNLRIRTSLKSRARDLGVNLSQTLERTLEQEISRREQEAWITENSAAIRAYNERIEVREPALSAYRSF
jgi:antitoxin CcdA